MADFALSRGNLGDDGKMYPVILHWERRSKQFTQEFEAFALTLIWEMPVKQAGYLLSKSDLRMWPMLFA